MPKIYSYVRFSSDKQEEGDSLRRQTELAEKWAASHPELGALELDTSTYRDLGVSAFRGDNAETGRLAEFRDAIRTGLVETGSYLIVESLDRLSRTTAWDAMTILREIVKSGVIVVTLLDGQIYTKDNIDDPMKLIMGLLIYIRANEESKMKSNRGSANWKRKRQDAVNGKVMSKLVVSWLEVTGDKDNRQFSIIEDKAATVRMIVDLFLSGKGCQAIATKLNTDNVPMLRNGKRWEPRSIHSILSNPALCGRYQMGEKAVQAIEPPIDNYYPALISVDTFNEISLMLNTGNVKQRDPIANPVAGICFCSVCGSKLTRFKTTKSQGGERLICTAGKVGKCEGGYKTIKLPIVYSRLKMIVKHPKILVTSRQNERFRLRLLQMDLETKISNVLEHIIIRGDHSEALASSLKGLEAEKAVIDGQLAEEAQKAVLGDKRAMEIRLKEAREAIEANDIERVNGLFRRLFDRVVVDMKKQTIKPHWIGNNEASSKEKEASNKEASKKPCFQSL
jgi:DNA invertase Pin-like site-specific DNA recombinase